MEDTVAGCLGYAATAITGETFEDFCTFAGHRATDKAFCFLDTMKYLNQKGYYLVTSANYATPVYESATEREVPAMPGLSPQTMNKLSILSDAMGKTINRLLDEAVDMFLTRHEGSIPEDQQTDKFEGIPGGAIRGIGKRLISFKVPIPVSQPALVIVGGNKGAHAVYWDGVFVIDNNFKDPQRLEKYTVLMWYPIFKL